MPDILQFDVVLGDFNFQLYRAFVDDDRLYLVHLANSVVSVDRRVLASLHGLSPDEMVAKRPKSFSFSVSELKDHALDRFWPAMQWRFMAPNGKRISLGLGHFGDPVETVAVLLQVFGESSIGDPKKPEAKELLSRALQRLEIDSTSSVSKPFRTAVVRSSEPPTPIKYEVTARQAFFSFLLIAGVAIGALARGCN